MLVLHANWMNQALCLWGETPDSYLDHLRSVEAEGAVRNAHGAASPTTHRHPFAVSAAELRTALSQLQPSVNGDAEQAEPRNELMEAALRLRLPRGAFGPLPSDHVARLAEANDGAIDPLTHPWLDEFEIPSLAVAHPLALKLMLQLEVRRPTQSIAVSQSVRYWIAVARLVIDLLEDQRFIPTLIHRGGNGLTAAWQPWLHDEPVRRSVEELISAMPPVVRAVVDGHAGRPWSILDEALRVLADSAVREALTRQQFGDALADRDPATDPHVAWLSGLLDRENKVRAPVESGPNLLRDATAWVGRLDETGRDQPYHLYLRLREPDSSSWGHDPTSVRWPLSFHLQSGDDSSRVIGAAQIWNDPSATPSHGESRPIELQETLLGELGRASRIYSKIEQALAEPAPQSVWLTTAEAYEFLRDIKPVLEESGFAIAVPQWWDQPLGRLGARLQVEPLTDAPGTAQGQPISSMLGLNSLVNFRWQIAVGDQPLSVDEFMALKNQTAPLVQVRGRWIEISPEQFKQARQLLQQEPNGQMTLLQAIQVSHGINRRHMTLPVHGMDASGWIADVLGASGNDQRMPVLKQPASFIGTLRPYQNSGLSWLAYLDRFGLGTCLADDMGLGKTIQLIALLLHERESVLASNGARHDQSERATPNSEHSVIGPTLIIAPTSVIANWVRELARFAPSLTVHVHHGPERLVGDRFVEVAGASDVVMTTYPLVSRDLETLQRVHWHRVTLDEAQYIKNPPTKQTTAIRSLRTTRRVALTGTPVENRLSELWSIMEFCNPGYLGHAGEFRRLFAIPVERHRDAQQAERLRHMVRPFVLRRLKTDSSVISDLPACVQTKEFATLTPEQAMLYQQTVNSVMNDVDRAEGMQRRGLVLAALVKLKQICNHPATNEELRLSAQQAPTDPLDGGNGLASASLSSRSGKAKRLMTMLEEVLAAGGKALVFTQFRQMGHLLTAMIQSDLDTEALFLHGGIPAGKRQHLIDRFQSEDRAAPIFVLSLKAGGLGLNLTAANHVFHYDRWWNPAVENQATDRAFRIGQLRNVQVHKFVCVGTLEERIDQMIEQKTELADNIIGSGEQWLTELSNSQLHDLLVLRSSAMEAES